MLKRLQHGDHRDTERTENTEKVFGRTLLRTLCISILSVFSVLSVSKEVSLNA